LPFSRSLKIVVLHHLDEASQSQTRGIDRVVRVQPWDQGSQTIAFNDELGFIRDQKCVWMAAKDVVQDRCSRAPSARDENLP
jgi:hypothetical protein